MSTSPKLSWDLIQFHKMSQENTITISNPFHTKKMHGSWSFFSPSIRLHKQSEESLYIEKKEFNLNPIIWVLPTFSVIKAAILAFAKPLDEKVEALSAKLRREKRWVYWNLGITNMKWKLQDYYIKCSFEARLIEKKGGKNRLQSWTRRGSRPQLLTTQSCSLANLHDLN